MRALLLVTSLCLLYLAAAHLSGGRLYTFGLPLGGEVGEVRNQVMSFWEDVQYKDFVRAASYHTPEKRDDVDIPFLLERLFLQKPESIDIMSFEVVDVDIDSTQQRARARSRIKMKDLLREEIKTRELMLYFHRQQGQWYMELESSLRQLSADPKKKH